ncbi:MAG TPA: hypothetical protein VNL37_04685 [Candidatus Polarisedimenticolia bacterium]|nr:hypothetical protein [Candidatus Polarisedimenticolia bacterium]
MRFVVVRRVLTAGVAVLAGLLPAALSGCAFHLPPKPEVYRALRQEFRLPKHDVLLHCVKPAKPRSRRLLILFATGDAGWLGTSHQIFEHMANEGYYVAAYSSREVLKPARTSGRLVAINDAAGVVESLLEQSRRILGLPGTTPVIVTGFSRGANLVVLTAGVKSLQRHLVGAIAMALTRETDFLKAPPPSLRPPAVQVDERGRIQTYPAIELAGSIPFAVIESKRDHYVPAEESRRLFGPDTDTRRLYQVDAESHGFRGGKKALLHDLDDALGWIEGKARAR